MSGRELSWFPEGLDPAAAGDPFSGFRFGDALLHARKEILERVRPFQIQIHFPLPNAENVTVRISEPGKYGTALQIDDSCVVAAESFRLGIRSDEHNTISFYRDRLGMRLFFVNGVDVAV